MPSPGLGIGLEKAGGQVKGAGGFRRGSLPEDWWVRIDLYYVLGALTLIIKPCLQILRTNRWHDL